MTLHVGLLVALFSLVDGSWWSGSSEEDEGRDRLRGIGTRVVEISPVEVEEQQAKWGEGIVALGKLLEKHSVTHVRQKAERFVADLYGTDVGDVLLKPTGVLQKPYRHNARGLVSWLIGNDPDFPEDVGFATKGWQEVRFRNAGITLTGEEALAMGNSFWRDPKTDQEVKMEYTMGFTRDRDGRIRMNLHFSSVPCMNETNALHDRGITQEDIESAQKSFVRSIIRMGRQHHASERVKRFVDNTFAYNEGQVLFKPPDEPEEPFRTSRYGVYSYFGGYADEYHGHHNGDKGFVKEAWHGGHFHNAGIILDGSQAWVMGLYSFWRDGERRFDAEFSMGYTRDSMGRLRVNMFSASVPSEAEEQPHWRRKDCRGAGVSVSAIEEMQKAWADGIMDIGSAYAAKGPYRRRAEEFVDRIYAYQIRPVLYKPADAVERTFRTSREGAISYFVGGDRNFPQDKGFALQGWEHVHFTNVDVMFAGDVAMTMGFVSYAGSSGVWRTAEITMGFILDEERQLRINMQHGTFPDRARVQWDASKHLSHRQMTVDKIRSAQEEWGRWIVRIGEAHRNATKARLLAEQMVDAMYDFSGGQVLFNVIKATNVTRFRNTRRGVISYLIGGDCIFSADRGFAVEQPWSKVRFRNHGMMIVKRDKAHIYGTSSFCCDSDGEEFEVHHTMGYLADLDGKIRLFLHDMAAPYGEELSSSPLDAALSPVRSAVSMVHGVRKSSGIGGVAAIVAVPVVLGLFVYFACCWSAGKLGAGGGAGARQGVGDADYYSGGYGSGAPGGFGYANGAGLQGGARGSYTRSVGAGVSYASAAGMGYQDQYGPPSSYSRGYAAVPGGASASPYMSGAAGGFYPQQGQSGRPPGAARQMRGSWRTSNGMSQRMY